MVRRLIVGLPVCALLVVSLAVPARAAKLTTTNIYIPEKGSIHCTATNVTTASMQVDITILTIGATVVKTAGVSISPGKGFSLFDLSPGVGGYIGRCLFQFNGPKTALRAATILYTNGTPQSGATPAILLAK